MLLRTHPTARQFAISTSVVLLLIVLLYQWLLHRPTSPAIERAEAGWCRIYYQGARTAADSAKVADGYWVVDHGWRRIPTCGELLREGKL
jgi:hypothetical protein